MTSVYVVGKGDCESSYIISIHQNRDSALKVWNEERLKLIEEARYMLEWSITENHGGSDKMYERILKNLEETDPEKIDNYPHECCFLTEYELEE